MFLPGTLTETGTSLFIREEHFPRKQHSPIRLPFLQVPLAGTAHTVKLQAVGGSTWQSLEEGSFCWQGLLQVFIKGRDESISQDHMCYLQLFPEGGKLQWIEGSWGHGMIKTDHRGSFRDTTLGNGWVCSLYYFSQHILSPREKFIYRSCWNVFKPRQNPIRTFLLPF